MPDKLYVGLGNHETTSLQGITKRAKACKQHRFQNLYALIDEKLLHECWRSLNKRAASGVDGVTAARYGETLCANIEQLAARLKTKRYRAKLVRRCYIPKEGGKVRPLGIPVLEDKLVQLCCAKILSSIYEQDFLAMSYGYRPRKSARDAVCDLGFNLQYGSYGYAVEADVKGFFDRICHDELVRLLEIRIDDKAFLGLIKQWLKAGILGVDGEVMHPQTGSPQGGVVSPVLANVYLHYVLDDWFEHVVKKHVEGKALLVRYADDYVATFQYKTDAKRYFRAMESRLSRFGLELSKEKSGLRRLSRFDHGLHNRIEFLGFEIYWGRAYDGEIRIKQRTARSRLYASIARIKNWVKINRHMRGSEFVKALNRRLNGHYNYFGVKSNEPSIKRFFDAAIEAAFKWLNRRGGKKSSFTWPAFIRALNRLGVSKPRVPLRKQAHVVYN